MAKSVFVGMLGKVGRLPPALRGNPNQQTIGTIYAAPALPSGMEPPRALRGVGARTLGRRLTPVVSGGSGSPRSLAAQRRNRDAFGRFARD